jgi:acetyltransferase EpsM
MRIVILGAGGHAQVLADTLIRAQAAGAAWELVGFLDDDPTLVGQQRLGLRILGELSILFQMDHAGCAIGIGDNRVRERLFKQLIASRERLISVIHPHATIAPDASIGVGAAIFAGVVVNTGSVIGNNVVLNTGCTVDHHNTIESHAHIAPGAHLGGDVKIGEGALIGIGAVVMPQRRVGAWCTVGAGAVVTRDLPDQVVAIGAPARIIRTQG